MKGTPTQRRAFYKKEIRYREIKVYQNEGEGETKLRKKSRRSMEVEV